MPAMIFYLYIKVVFLGYTLHIAYSLRKINLLLITDGHRKDLFHHRTKTKMFKFLLEVIAMAF